MPILQYSKHLPDMKRFLLACDCVSEDRCSLVRNWYFAWEEEEPEFGIEASFACEGLPLWERVRDAWRMILGRPLEVGWIAIEQETLAEWIELLKGILGKMEKAAAKEDSDD